MTVAQRVREARNPQEAVLALAEALDRFEVMLEVIADEVTREPSGKDPWGEWTAPEAPPSDTFVDTPGRTSEVPTDGRGHVLLEQHDAAVAAMQNTDAREIEIPPPSEEKMERRRLLAKQQLKLNDVLPSEQGIDWDEVYIKGGPLWLYNADRSVVMQYDYPVRQQMVADVEEDSPEQAYLMSIDVLKQPAGEPDFENGSGALAVGWVTGGKGK